jgi:hypothetical protein
MAKRSPQIPQAQSARRLFGMFPHLVL